MAKKYLDETGINQLISHVKDADSETLASAKTYTDTEIAKLDTGVTGVKGDSETAYRTGQVNITKANIGLANVDNTSDIAKPISTATQTALNTKANSSDLSTLQTKVDNLVTGVSGVKGSTETTYRTGNVNITKADIGLANVNNTSDADKPISSAAQTALDKKQDILDYNSNIQVKSIDIGSSLFGIGADEIDLKKDLTFSIKEDKYLTIKGGIKGTYEEMATSKISNLTAITANVTGTLTVNGTDISTTLNNKQNKLTAGGNIAIDATTNKISVKSNPGFESMTANIAYIVELDSALTDDITVNKDLKVVGTITQNGSKLATLDSTGKVPSSQLPSFVDDVIEGYYYNSKFYKESTHTTEVTGETGKIYVDLTTEKTYRWSGTAYVEISASLALGETSSTAYPGNKGKTALETANSALAKANTNTSNITTLTNTINTTKSDISALKTNVDTNTTNITSLDTRTQTLEESIDTVNQELVSQTQKLSSKIDTNTNNISTVTSDLTTISNTITNQIDDINTKLGGLVTGVSGVRGADESSYQKGNVTITKAAIGLGKVDNTSDLNKPISSATQTALDKKQDTLTDNQLKAVSSGITSSLVSQITNNKTNIETNTNTISTLQKSVDTNTTNIATNTSTINTLQTNISTNTNDIATIKTQIADLGVYTPGTNIQIEDYVIALKDYLHLTGISLDTIEANSSVEGLSLRCLYTNACEGSLKFNPDETIYLGIENSTTNRLATMSLNVETGAICLAGTSLSFNDSTILTTANLGETSSTAYPGNKGKTATETANSALSKANTNATNIAKLETSTNTLKTTVDTNTSDIANLSTSVSTLQTSISTLSTTANDALTKANSNASAISDIKTKTNKKLIYLGSYENGVAKFYTV